MLYQDQFFLFEDWGCIFTNFSFLEDVISFQSSGVTISWLNQGIELVFPFLRIDFPLLFFCQLLFLVSNLFSQLLASDFASNNGHSSSIHSLDVHRHLETSCCYFLQQVFIQFTLSGTRHPLQLPAHLIYVLDCLCSIISMFLLQPLNVLSLFFH